MKEFSICRDPKAGKPEILSWERFGEIMKSQGVDEAMIYFTADKYDRKRIIERGIFALLVEKDGEKAWAEYNIIDHENGDKIRPCLVILDADPKYVLKRSVVHFDNSFIIQCIFMNTGEFKVNKLEVVHYDDTDFSLN
jgi:hypothetical protein